MKLLKFSRPSCNPCTMVGNYLNDKGVSFEEYNVEEDLEQTALYNISGVPTTILLDENGDIVDRVVGFNPPELNKLINKL